MSKSEKKTCPSKSKDVIKSYNAEWYAKNREQHLAYMKEKLYCDCGAKVCRNNLQRHLRSTKHQEWESNDNKEEKCKCGGHYKKGDKGLHMKGKKHQKYLLDHS